jgi:hypothetical protein
MLVVGLCALLAFGKVVIGPQVPAIRQIAERELLSLVTAILPWGRFVGSVALSAVGLSWLTAAFFALSALLLRALPLWLDRASRGSLSRLVWLHWKQGIKAAMDKHPRIIGSLLNLLSGTLALGVFSWLTGVPLDEWDLGIEAALVLLIELAILGWVGHTGRGAQPRP